MKRFLILATLLITPLAIYAPTDNSKNAVQPCGAGAACEQTINAIADVEIFAIPRDKFTSLGTITEDRTVNVVMPKEPGTQTAYSFIPSTGESKDKVIDIVFAHKIQKPGTRLFGKSVVKIYRRFSTDPKDSMTEIGTIFLLNKPELDKHEEHILLKRDGTAVYRNPLTNKPIIFLAGTKDLSAAAAQEKAEEEAASKKATA